MADKDDRDTSLGGSSRSTSHASSSQRAGGSGSSTKSGSGGGMGAPPGGSGSGGPGWSGGSGGGSSRGPSYSGGFSQSQFGGGGGGSGSPSYSGGFSQSQFGGGGSSNRTSGGGGYGSYSGPSRYGPPGQSSQGFRSLVNASNSIGGSPQQRVANVLSNMGLGYNAPLSLAGMMGTFGHESGFNPSALGDYGTAHGLAQWRGDRWGNMQDYAGQMGLDPRDIAAQAAFAGTELQSQYPGAYQGVVGAQSVPEAVAAMNAYERPFGWKPGGNPQKVAGWADRVKRATAFAGGMPQPSSPPSVTASLGQGIAPGASAQVQAAPTYSETSPGFLNYLSSIAGQGLTAAKTYGADYLERAKSPENVMAWAGQNPGAAMKLASAFGSLSPGGTMARHPGEGGGSGRQMASFGRQMASADGEWFKKPSSQKKSSGKDKSKEKRQTPKWVFPSLFSRPYTLIS